MAVAQLQPEPRSAPLARTVVRDCLAGTEQDGLVDTLQQCVTELVTNAVLHAGTVIRVELHSCGSGVRLEVHDGSTSVPVLSPHSLTASTGRGLAMVATLCDSWGVEVLPDGKVIWCEVSGEHTTDDEHDLDEVLAAWGLSAVDLGDDPVAVEGTAVHAGDHPVLLLGYPVELGLSLQEHYESVVRECQLLAAPRAPGADPLPPRLLELATILAERYVTELSQLARPDPRRIAAQAQGLDSVDLDFSASAAQIVLLISWQSILDDVDDFSARGDLLAPTISPEMTLLRGWALGEFVLQSQGQPPRPWASIAPPA